ncbi:hypothetical protein BH18THE1_BH18THE1_18220 [soil metagenome]
MNMKEKIGNNVITAGHNCCQIVPLMKQKKKVNYKTLLNYLVIHLSRVSLYLDLVTRGQNPLMKGKDRNY